MEEKNFAQMRKEFIANYKSKILPKLKKFESERKKRFIFAIVMPFPLTFVISTVVYLLMEHNFPEHLDSFWAHAVFLIPSFLLFSLVITYIIIKKHFEKKIKKLIMPIVCGCFGDLKWSQGKYYGEDLFKTSNLIPAVYSSKHYDDIFIGTFKNINIEIIEAEFSSSGSGKRSSSSTIFDGIIIKVDMNKKFNSHTLIKKDSDSTYYISSFSAKLRHTTFEDVNFEKEYNVYTNDEVDARYLITPTFMERLNNIKTIFSSSVYRCAFYNNCFLIALSTYKDLFSIGELNKPLADKEQFIKMYDEIESILKLIDHFKLNQKIGL